MFSMNTGSSIGWMMLDSSSGLVTIAEIFMESSSIPVAGVSVLVELRHEEPTWPSPGSLVERVTEVSTASMPTVTPVTRATEVSAS